MAAHARDMWCETFDLDRAQRHPHAILPDQQIILGASLQAAKITAQHWLDLAFELPAANATGTVGRDLDCRPRQGPGVDDAHVQSGWFGGSTGGGISSNSIEGMC